MTVGELEKELCAGEHCVVCVPMRDVIADWRLMRERLLGFRDGDMYRRVADQAGDTLADLRLEP